MTRPALLLFLVAPTACAGVYSDPNPAAPLSGETSAGDAGAAIDAMPPGGKTSGPKHMFVTGQTYQGGLLGGLAGADAKCAARAAAGGLAGQYKAWLSDRQTTAAYRLTQTTGTYSLVDGTRVADNWDGLVSGSLAHAIDHDELGQLYAPPLTCFVVGGIVPVWTATQYNGSYAQTDGQSCTNWTEIQHDGLFGNGSVGSARSHDSHWTDSLCALSCSDTAALYCLEQ